MLGLQLLHPAVDVGSSHPDTSGLSSVNLTIGRDGTGGGTLEGEVEEETLKVRRDEDVHRGREGLGDDALGRTGLRG